MVLCAHNEMQAALRWWRWLRGESELWIFTCFLRTPAAREGGVVGKIMGEVGHLGQFCFTSSSSGRWVAFGFYSRAAAELAHALDPQIREVVGLAPHDMDFGPITETYYGACVHTGDVLQRERLAECAECGETVGAWEDYGVGD